VFFPEGCLSLEETFWNGAFTDSPQLVRSTKAVIAALVRKMQF